MPRSIVYLRHRRGWRQSDLGDRAEVSRPVISRIEQGDLSGVSIRSLTRVVAALDASAELVVRWRGERFDRLIDADHARIVQGTVTLLQSLGWASRVEVSFNHYGDRGRVDVMAMHAPSRTVLIVEVKSAIGDIQDTVGRLDIKARLGKVLASSVGWEAPAWIIPALVVADSRVSRRAVADHHASFSGFEVRGRTALAWLRRPSVRHPTGALWFMNIPNARGGGVRQRVRVPAPRGRSS